jgi:hypothetical protein
MRDGNDENAVRVDAEQHVEWEASDWAFADLVSQDREDERAAYAPLLVEQPEESANQGSLCVAHTGSPI